MDLQKLKAKRSGNRGAVTRLLRKFEEAKDSSDYDREDLLSSFQSVIQKKELLVKLNEEIEDSSELEDMEEEIMSTDEYMTNLNTHIRHFQNFLHKPTPSNLTDHIPSQPISQILNADSPSFVPASSSSAPPASQSNVQTFSQEATQVTPSYPYAMHTPAFPAISVQQTDHAPTASNVSQQTGYTNAINSIPAPSYQPSFAPQSYVGPSTSYSQHQLPKLTLPSFSGNILKWQSFWDAFESAVHSNPNLTDVQRFNYLRAQLEGDASATIAGFAVTNINYIEAVNVLKERFGQTHKIVEMQIQAIVELIPPRNNLQSLRSFYDKMEALVRGMEALGQRNESYGSLLVPVIMNKIPGEIRRSLARVYGNRSLTLHELRRTILNEIQIMEAGPFVESSGYAPTSTLFAGARKSPKKHRNGNPTHSRSTFSNTKSCVYCKEFHAPTNCTAVTELEKRVSIVKRNNLCFNCLGSHHLKECKSKSSCRICNKKHHTSLCNALSNNDTSEGKNTNKQAMKFNRDNRTNTSTTVTLVNDTEYMKEEAQVMHASSDNRSSVLLKTAVAPVWSNGECINANILLDEGAQRSFISDDLASKLNLTRNATETIQLSAFGEHSSNARQLDAATIYLETLSGHKIPLKVLIVPKIAVPLHSYARDVNRGANYLKGLKFAHPVTTDETFNISLLIGADFFWDIVEDEVIRGNGPTAVRSKLGYLLSGPMKTTGNKSSATAMYNVLVSHKIEEHDLEMFWKLETIGIESPEIEKKNEYLTTYQDSSIEFRDNRYVAKLPWKEAHNELPTNYTVTKKRTESVIRRLRQDPKMLKKYGDIITEQERRGFIEKVDEKEPTATKVHYIPHHPVKKDSSTTPIRIVYDCSCKMSPDHASLNDCLMDTPPELNDLTKILIRFRLHPFAVTTDIEKAFLHVGLHENDRDVTRFLWLSDPSDPNSQIITYRFKAILFGATCSPFILSATLLKHLQQCDQEAAKILERDLYVDNVLTSVKEEHEALDYYQDSRNLMTKAGFNLRSWTSNSAKVRNEAKAAGVLDTDSQTKVLGMRWNSETDKLYFQERKIIPNSTQITTKREILKHSSRIYDPLGMLSPITIRAKLLLQELWKQGFDWDQQLNSELCNRWTEIATDIEDSTKLPIDRYYFSDITSSDETKLHVFVDASTKAYGAVAYICRGKDSELVMSKTRVSPLKELTLPQLELMAAVIGARLIRHIQTTLVCKDVTIWSDSQIVLHWIKSTKTLKRFVANRISEIRELTEGYTWYYCPTDSNPADLLTRGLSYQQFKENNLWRKGPSWICNPSTYQKPITSDTTLSLVINEHEDIQTSSYITTDSDLETGIQKIIDIHRYGSYKKLLRVTAYVYRFIENCRKQTKLRDIGPLKSDKIENCAKLWIRNCQKTTLTEEYVALKSGDKSRNKYPRIRQLDLFMDNNNMIRCRGRIHNAQTLESAKFPYFLPAHHQLSNLIVIDAHERSLHGGINTTITQLRQTFWIPAARQLARKLLKSCVTCRKVNGKPYTSPVPPPLPKIRLQEAPPFTATGIDFSGALQIKDREKVLHKAYICLFTCATSRAVHLEIVTNLTETSFILAFRRFSSRHSVPKYIMTDNATTFVSASEEIRNLCNSNKIQDEFASQGIEWRFIPKRAPWFGGWWERLIGLTKTSLKKILGKSLVDLESLQTVIAEIECILNDRPLTYASSDNNDPEVLTPAHLLYGRRLRILPYPKTDEIDIDEFHHMNITSKSVSKRVKQQKLIIQHFLDRWRSEYLTSLREFHKVTGGKTNIKTGDVVQIHDEKPRITWKTGIVEELQIGNDGNVRSATVRTKNGYTTRPIIKLYPLELRCETSDESSSFDEPEDPTMRPFSKRRAAHEARDKIKQWTK